MDNLRNSIEILFHQQKPEVLLMKHSVWRNLVSKVEKDFFTKTYLAANPPFTGDQADMLYKQLSENWMKDGEKTSVFQVLLAFAQKVLRVKEGMPVCRYEDYLRWHEMTASIGEDILTCSFLASEDKRTYTARKNFAWKTVLESDNIHLEALFSRGLSELHCHLNGSSINFDLNWLAIMNEPGFQKREWFQKASGHPNQLYEYSLLAAFIRMYLYIKTNNFICGPEFEKTYNRLLNDKDKLFSIQLYVDKLQAEIAYHSEFHARKFEGGVIDYAIPASLSIHDSKHPETQLLVGERKLMYECFRRVLDNDFSIPEIGISFYLYLVIKMQVKDLLIQHNNIKGFDNFKKFDKNKDLFVEHSRNKTLQHLIQKLTLYSYTQDAHIDYLEYRIAPKKTASAIRRKLNDISQITDEIAPKETASAIRRKPNDISQITDDKDKVQCVCHFIKSPDRERYYEDEVENQCYCRNYNARQKYKRESRALEILLKKFENRIVGIDAANSEFGCRPEVFGEVFRRLQHLERNTSMENLIEMKWQDLGITYHVGEDYYDIVDGLRAIEEAILFLNLSDGSRLGHAVALGIGVMEYYKERKNTIIIPKQDLLDNCVWLLAKMDEYAIVDENGVRNNLMYEMQRLLNEIYPNCMEEDYRTYYQSWLLRGDEPLLYMNASSKTKAPKDGIIAPYGLNHFEKRIDEARNLCHARVLYRQYHYDSGVKHRGHKPEEWRLPDGLPSVIDKIQKQMRNEVAKRKIAIEVNPTSNLRICNINTYDTHPVVKFRNYGLSLMNEYDDCPQISVSINTDDKGIFATSLEKEYTLMALALEKQETSDGKPKYLPNNILNWLEELRQEAEIQRFRK
jgi:adenosine deaminase